MRPPSDRSSYTPKHNIEIPPAEPRWETGWALGDKIVSLIIGAFQAFMAWAIDLTIDMLAMAVDQGAKVFAPGLRRVSYPMLDEMLAQPQLPAYIRTVLTNLKNERGESEPAMLALTFVCGLFAIFDGLGAPWGQLMAQISNKYAQPFLASPETLITMAQRGYITYDQLAQELFRHGLDENHTRGFMGLVEQRLTPDELALAFYRGVIDEPTFRKRLEELGYRTEAIETFIKATNQIPNVGDLISMMVRDAFNPAIVDKYQYGEDYPESIEQYTSAQGVRPEWVKRYWYSHWVLPSPTQAYEMLHRGLISEQELRDLLKTADYAPWWRDKLMAISYNPYTRVDLRRLYQAKLINEEVIYSEYRAQGYDAEHARNLTAFALLGQAEEEKDLTRADLIGAYTDHIIDKSQLQTSLKQLGYDDAEISILIGRADKDISSATQTEDIANVKEQFTAKEISEAEAIVSLANAGVARAKIDRLISQWRRANVAKPVKPSKSDLDAFLSSGLIDVSDYQAALSEMGYSARYIALYTQQAQPSVIGVTPKPLSRADIESAYLQDRMNESEVLERLAILGFGDAERAVIMDEYKTNRAAKRLNDVRRILQPRYVEGIIDTDQARIALEQAGANGDDITTLLAQWGRARNAAAKVAQEKAKQSVSKADALALFKAGQIDEKGARERLAYLNYSQDAIDLLVANAKAEITNDAKQTALALARTQFLQGVITDIEARQVMLDAGWTAAQIDATLAEWQRAAESRVTRLTQAQALKMYTNGVITIDGYREYLVLLEYPENEIELLLTQAGVLPENSGG